MSHPSSPLLLTETISEKPPTTISHNLETKTEPKTSFKNKNTSSYKSSVAEAHLERILSTSERKRRRKCKVPQAYPPDSTSSSPATKNSDTDDSRPMSSTSDVEYFQGKIVYNVDGSALIIDTAENASITEEQSTAINDARTSSRSAAAPVSTKSDLNAITTATALKSVRPQKYTPQQNPRIHSFRVVSAHDASIVSRQNPNTFKIQKPILMCFICKLSFGNTKTFSSHANTEHALNLEELEQSLLKREYSSAIIQRNVDEKPQISFLEPLDVKKVTTTMKSSEEETDTEMEEAAAASSAAIKIGVGAFEGRNTNVETSSSAPITKAILNADESNSNSNISKTLKDTIDTKTGMQYQQHEQHKEITSEGDSITTTNVETTLHASSSPLSSPRLLHSPSSMNTRIPTRSKSPQTNFGFLGATVTATTIASSSVNTVTKSNYTTTKNSSFIYSSCTSSSPSPRSPTTNSSSAMDAIAKLEPPSNTKSNSVTTTTTSIIDAKSTDNLSISCKSSNKVDCCPTNLITKVEDKEEETIELTADNSNRQSPSKISTQPTELHSLALHHLRSNSNTEDCSLLQQQQQLLQEQQHQPSLLQQEHQSLLIPSTPPLLTAAAATLSAQNHLSSLHASLAAALTTTSDHHHQNSTSVKLISEFLQQQLVAVHHHQQQQQQHSFPPICPEHPDFKGIDCKTCELLEIQQHFKPSTTPQRSPNSNNNSGNGSSNPVATSGVNSGNTSSVSSSFTIGACSDHINGRPLGIDCARCEIILNSARLNSGAQMSTRNSCKTLKCPQCNWHYKYQETLEIHMREKHPDGESACGYCLAGQQHPRLARGESYSCGYKPYRCEICNYSTTTKGNLSIHMQSDKHLNNMQELNNSQNMVAAAAAAAAACKLETTAPKNLMLAGPQQQQTQQHQQQIQAQQHHSATNNSATATLHSNNISSSNNNTASSTTVAASALSSSTSNKPKPSFRCDICSYETSVARNLRIHMTSEKHTHNLAVLQNNIKHIQAFSFLQQQHQQATAAAAAAAVQQQQQQQHLTSAHQQHLSAAAQNAAAAAAVVVAAAGGGNASAGGGGNLPNMPAHGHSSFLPEVALADIAYNQALMIQLLQQQQQQQQQQNTTATQQHKEMTANQNAKPTSPMSPLPLPLPTTTITTTAQAQLSQTQAQSQFSPNAKSPAATFFNDTTVSVGGGGGEICLSSNCSSEGVEGPPPPIKPDPFPTTLYSCLVCTTFKSNSLDELNQHLLIDRSRQFPTGSSNSSSDIMVILNNNYICRLCNYKTNLKANFQLHSKTDKHLQKLNFINHLREGGPNNEYRLKYQQLSTNAVQLKCNCCDFYTNSIQKLSLHTQHMRHDTMRIIFQHLLGLLQRKTESPESTTASSSTNKSDAVREPNSIDQQQQLEQLSYINRKSVLLCQLCNYAASDLYDMLQHVKSLRHMQVEQFICLQRRSENMEPPVLNDIFKLSSSPMTHNEDIAKVEQISPSSKPLPLSTISTSEGGIDSSTTQLLLGTETNTATSPVSTSSKNSAAFSGTLESGSLGLTENILPPVIYKCHNCDYFAQSKNEIETHNETVHPNAEQDYISIPTNAAAVQAFQAAVAAATAAAAAAVRRCSTSQSPPVAFDENEDDKDECPIEIKKERRDSIECQDVYRDEEKPTRLSIETSLQPRHQKPNSEISQLLVSKDEQENLAVIQCPLCQTDFTQKQILELHLMRTHSVSRDGLARLLKLVEVSSGTNNNSKECSASTSSFPAPVLAETVYSDLTLSSAKLLDNRLLTTSLNVEVQQEQTSPLLDPFICQHCGAGFKHEQLLLQHAQKNQHFVLQDSEYLCLASNSTTRPCRLSFASLTNMISHYKDTHMSLVISERHVYKYRCKQCSLAFKTQEKLTTHTLYHTMRDATKCGQCQRNFRSTHALQKHMEQVHPTAPNDKITSEDVTSGSTMQRVTSNLTIEDCGSELENKTPSVEEGDRGNEPPIPEAAKEVKGPITPTPTSMSPDLQKQQQQQNVAAITAALLKQQQLQFGPGIPDSENGCSQQGNDTSQRLQMDSSVISQHQLEANHFQGLQSQLQNFQDLQSLQQMQHQLPQLAAAAAASGLPLNPMDVLNLMQFHHLMSLNFMNLAPPLIFGATATESTPQCAPKVDANTGIEGIQKLPAVTNMQRSALLAGNSAISTNLLTPLEVNTQKQQQQQQQQQTSPASISQLTSNQKRARTRITDDQLKILRAHFDINNSPSEESIMKMSQKANLPMKVVKHWFRNTLFKERQRNKDSPYNFNNPPSTTLNLEEYERTGQAKVTTLNETPPMPCSSSIGSNIADNVGVNCVISCTGPSSSTTLQSYAESTHSGDDCEYVKGHQLCLTQKQQQKQDQQQHQAELNSPKLSSDLQINPGSRSSHNDDYGSATECEREQQEKRLQKFSGEDDGNNILTAHNTALAAAANLTTAIQQQQQQQQQQHQQIQQQQQQLHSYYNSYETKSESGSSDILSRPQSPSNSANNRSSTPHLYASMNELLSHQLDNLPLNSLSTMGGSMNNMGPPKKLQTSKTFEKNSPSSQFDNNSNSSNSSSTSSGKRANRTRFTDYQIKVLQEFFENNSYPKDSDLEYLSKLLLLSPRVIVVWFQNARQKQRKIYENQPNNSLYETEEKKQNINYACKKCNLVFQRYYELIRHQKNHCFKEENNKKSAKAQIAAAQIAQNLSSEDSNSSLDITSSNAANAAAMHHHHVIAAAAAALASGNSSTSNTLNLMAKSSPPQHLFGKSSSSLIDFSPSTTPTPPQRERTNSIEQPLHQHQSAQKHKFDCDLCKINFNHYEQFREHQLLHIMNPAVFFQQQQHDASSPSAYGPFGSILQNLQQAATVSASPSTTSHQTPPAAKKRKYSESSSIADDLSSIGGTSGSISGEYGEAQALAKRYDFLYQYFMENETNVELKQQFQTRRQQTQEHDFELEFLTNFYQQTELKKRSNYDFLYQYYMRNEPQTVTQAQMNNANEQSKLNMDFLLQYYQLNESKKFFQLDASPQEIVDSTGIHHIFPSKIQEEQHDEEQQKNVTEMKYFETENETNVNSTKQQKKDLSHIITQNKNEQRNGNEPANRDTADQELSCGLSRKIFGCEEEDHSSNHKNHHDRTSIHKLETHQASSMVSPPHNTYFQNLEDFLDASMIEHQSQTINFCETTTTTTTASIPAIVNTNKNINSAAKVNICNDVSTTNLENTFNSSSPAANAHVTSTTTSTSTTTATSVSTDKQQNKRLRTTILPEQLNFLYECYQNESNPSRKMLEEISKKVNLKKRVVQVWYQNSRARERKGQFRQNMQIINKKCPYCSGIFKIKSALEWHMQSKHADKPKINVDIIDDIKVNAETTNQPTPSSKKTTITMSSGSNCLPVNNSNNNNINSSRPLDLTSKNQELFESEPMQMYDTSGAIATSLMQQLSRLPVVNNCLGEDLVDTIIALEPEPKENDKMCGENAGSDEPLQQQQQQQQQKQNQQTIYIPFSSPDECRVLLSPSFSTSSSSEWKNSETVTPGKKKQPHTHVNKLQKLILRHIFRDVQMPTDIDCIKLSTEIDLQKRVVQVWFQNSRAKDKKSRKERLTSTISDESSTHDDSMTSKDGNGIAGFPSIKIAGHNNNTSNGTNEFRDCSLCQLTQVNIKQHAFSAEHIRRVKALLQCTVAKSFQINDENGINSEHDENDKNYENGHAGIVSEDKIVDGHVASNNNNDDGSNNQNREGLPDNSNESLNQYGRKKKKKKRMQPQEEHPQQSLYNQNLNTLNNRMNHENGAGAGDQTDNGNNGDDTSNNVFIGYNNGTINIQSDDEEDGDEADSRHMAANILQTEMLNCIKNTVIDTSEAILQKNVLLNINTEAAATSSNSSSSGSGVKDETSSSNRASDIIQKLFNCNQIPESRQHIFKMFNKI